MTPAQAVVERVLRVTVRHFQEHQFSMGCDWCRVAKEYVDAVEAARSKPMVDQSSSPEQAVVGRALIDQWFRDYDISYQAAPGTPVWDQWRDLADRIDAALAERARATWKAASEFVRASFLMGAGQRTYTWSDKQTEHIAAALAAKAEG